jgi:hypothetical protein
VERSDLRGLRPISQRCGKEKAELNFHLAPARARVAMIALAVESTCVTTAAYTKRERHQNELEWSKDSLFHN